MSFQQSTPEERQRSEDQVKDVEALIRRLRSDSRNVHLIWDVDRVLVSGRSDDAFTYLGFDVKKYFEHEERLITQPLEDGPFVRLARACGREGMHQTQDIVTARSSFLGLRVTFFLVRNFGIEVNWMLQVGHQSKKDSYRIILEACRKNAETHVISIDDTKKHNDAFDEVALALGMQDRCHSVLALPVRDYTEDELRHQVDAVMNVTGAHPQFVDTFDTETGRVKNRVLVTPNPRATIREMFLSIEQATYKRSIVEQHRGNLEAFAERAMPGAPMSIDNLFYLYELVREPR